MSTKRKTLILADQSIVVVNKVIAPITINLGSINVKIYGLVCPNLTIDIIAGLDWLRVFIPIIDLSTSSEFTQYLFRPPFSCLAKYV